MHAVDVSEIRKVYGKIGNGFTALDGVSFRISKGQAYGLLGPNGAGKTTMIQILTTLLKPTSGTATILGYDIISDKNQIKKRIGMAAGGTSFYWDFKPREILKYFSKLYGMSSSDSKRSMDFLIDKLGITPFEGSEFSQLSTGMRQKVAIAKSLLNDPEVLFLDEPTAGLDVEVALDVRNFLMDLIKERDMTVLLTSHQMGEVEHMCKKIAIINDGKVLKEGKISDIKDSIRINDVIRLHLDDYNNLDFVKKIPGVVHCGVSDGLFITVDSAKDSITRILSEFRKRKVNVTDLEVRKLSLEEVFLTLVGRKTTLPVQLGRGYDAE